MTTLGTWRPGIHPHSVVTDVTPAPPHIRGANDMDYYGGYLVAESVAPRLMTVVVAAPKLLAALKAIVKSLADADEEGLIEHAEQMQAAREAIAEAEGRDGH